MALMGFDKFCRKWEIGPYGEERVEFDAFDIDYTKDNEGLESLSIYSNQYYGGNGKIICKNDNDKINVKIISNDFKLANWNPKRDFDLFNDLELYACFGYKYISLGDYPYECSVTPVYSIGEKADICFVNDEPKMLDNSKTTTFDVAFNKINKFLELMDYDEYKKSEFYIDMVVKCLRESIKSYSWLDDNLLEMSDKEIWEDWNKYPGDETRKIKDPKGWICDSLMDVRDKYAEYLWENVI